MFYFTGKRKQQTAKAYPDSPSRQAEVSQLLSQQLEPNGKSTIYNFLAPLTQFHNRYYTGDWAISSSLFIAEWAKDLINDTGRQADASVELKLNPDFPQMNIVARIAGTNPAKSDMLIIGAHMDSINSQGDQSNWPEQRAPGADDDGSGSAVVMTVFQAMLNSTYRPERTFEFHWYAGEERGLLGSRVLANQYRQENREVHAMLQIDMCGGGGGFNFIMDYVNVELSRFEMMLVDEYCQTPYKEGECGYACSDHASWHDEGYPASFPIEISGAIDPVTSEPCRGHTDDDRLECVNLDLALDYARLAASFLIELD